MRVADELALVVELACLTEDRSPAEQKALLAVARRVDKDINRQTNTNRALDKDRPHRQPPCDYQPVHDKTCVCRGEGVAWRPTDGWSRLVALVEETIGPSREELLAAADWINAQPRLPFGGSEATP